MTSEISNPVKRLDFDEKINGSIRYTADMELPNGLFAKTLRSEHAYAQIINITTPSLPDGYFIITSKDIPHNNTIPVVENDWPIFAEEEVHYIGEPILLIVGPDIQMIENLMDQTIIEYAPFKPTLTLKEAMQNPPHLELSYTKGDFDHTTLKVLDKFEETFETGLQEQAYLETQSMMAIYEAPVIKVYGSMQCPYYIKDALQNALAFSPENIEVYQNPTGGGFGGKEDFPSVLGVHTALAAIKSGHPVKMIYDRSEDLSYTTKRHPCKIKLTTYFDENHHLVAREADIILDSGAYTGLTNVVLQRLSFSIMGVYNITPLHVSARAYKTHKPPNGAFRGFGGPQAFFAIESHMNHIASRLGVNPLDLRNAYLVKQGDMTSTEGKFRHPVKLPELVWRMETMSDYRNHFAESEEYAGVGISLFLHGCGFTGSGEKELLKSKVSLAKFEDGTVEIKASSTEIGQGSLTTLSKIVAQALEIPIDKVIHKLPSTANCPDSGPTVASRTTMIVGKILYDLCGEVKKRWNEPRFEVSAMYKYPSDLFWNNTELKGDAYPEYAWGANVVRVTFNPVTYEVDVKDIWAVYDIGTPIDSKMVKGQIDGGIVQGLGYASMEEMNHIAGKVLQNRLSTYIIPCSADFPEIKSATLFNPFEEGPFGARGLGELTLVGIAPAYAAAVEQATGVKVNALPITPERLRRLIHEQRK
ncbi:MAG: xanthine dehydrogenase family protein molybdopterin-binding subunit [Firmicutes bacterium]|nr:xanthine dehydrogenase family protein molybdopterin-binding subunit [Bacillota bacterium]